MARYISKPQVTNEDLTGTAALPEIAAMGRVAGLNFGKLVVGGRIAGMERDIARARRRGCGNRAATLEASILVHKALSRRMAAERERETIRTLVPEEKETVLQERRIGCLCSLLFRSVRVFAFSEYGNYDGLGLAELVRKGDVTPTELVEEAIQRIETHNPKLNAVINKLYERARDTAKSDLPDGPFKGVPFLMKDLMATLEGVPTSNGNKLWKDIPAKVDSELAQRWMNSGVVVVGKTNTPEFGLTPYTEF